LRSPEILRVCEFFACDISCRKYHILVSFETDIARRKQHIPLTSGSDSG